MSGIVETNTTITFALKILQHHLKFDKKILNSIRASVKYADQKYPKK